MVILAANEEKMYERMALFDELGKTYKAFYEPDLDDALTAVAFEPLDEQEGKKIFKKFSLI
jgi:hypothetical protein